MDDIQIFMFGLVFLMVCVFLVMILVILYIPHYKRATHKKLFIHKKTGGLYKMKGTCELRHPETWEWIPSFIYSSVSTRELYVRTKEDFLSKFIPLDEWLEERFNNKNNV